MRKCQRLSGYAETFGSVLFLLGAFITCFSRVSVAHEAARHVHDYLGAVLSTEKPARRIVALAPHIVENLFSIGAGEFIVATTDYADYPQAAKKIARIGSSQGMSLEAIMGYSPDLVILWHTGQAAQLLDKLRALGLRVYASDPRRLSDVARSLRDYEQLVFGQHQPQAAIDFDARLERLRFKYAHVRPVRIFYQVWPSPPMTINGSHLVSDAITLCGGQNVFADSTAIAPQVSIEAVLAANPDVIVAGSNETNKENAFELWQRFKALKAVANQQLYTVPADWMHRHTVRTLSATERLCEQLELAREGLH